jgi:hypothetical protein
MPHDKVRVAERRDQRMGPKWGRPRMAGEQWLVRLGSRGLQPGRRRRPPVWGRSRVRSAVADGLRI